MHSQQLSGAPRGSQEPPPFTSGVFARQQLTDDDEISFSLTAPGVNGMDDHDDVEDAD